MIKRRVPAQQRLILDNVSWKEYARFLRNFEQRHLRLTYDRGTLEIMTRFPTNTKTWAALSADWSSR